MVTWYRVHTAMGGKWIHKNHLPPIAVSTLYHVTIEVVNSPPTHNSVYSVSCYRWSCQFTSHGTEYTLLWVGSELTTSMVTWYRVHTAIGGKWIDNFNGNMVQSRHCYGWEVTMLPSRLWIHLQSIAVCTLYHVTIEVVNSPPTHSRVYSVPCYHWSCQFTSHP
jgi:hypothetical protein